MDDETITPAAAEPLQPRIEIVATPNYKPVVTFVILSITVLVYLWQIATLYVYLVDYPAEFGAKVNHAIIVGEFWRLFTPMLLHDDRLPIIPLHLLSNMYFLSIVGARFEKFSGHWRFLLLYIVAGFAGNVFSFLFSPHDALGASTALFGIMGAQVVFVLQNRQFLEGNGKPSLQNALTLIGLNVVIGFTIGADNWGHIGGLLGGAAFAWFGGPRLTLKEVAYPRFRLEEVGDWQGQLTGAALVMVLFGLLATLKILGIAF